MFIRHISIFILSTLFAFNAYSADVAHGRMARAKKYAEKRRYQVEAFDSYNFNLCQKYSTDKEDYYIYKCNEDEVITSPISNLERNQYRISKKVYSDNFLTDLKSFTLNSLKKNEDDIVSLINCFDSLTSECIEKNKSILNYVRTKVPSYRKTIALANIEKTSGRGFVFYNIPRDIEHDSLDYDIPELSDEEMLELDKIKEEISYNINQDALSQTQHNCIKYGYEYKLKNCPRRIRRKLSRDLNIGIERVKDQYQKEYYKRTDADNLLARLNLRGDESDKAIFKELRKQLSKSVSANRKAYQGISKLSSDDDLVDLIKNRAAVQGYLQTQGVSKASCDVAQSIYSDVESSQLMTSLYLGGAAIVGGGICLGTFGLGCAIGVGVAAEAIDLYMQQNNLNNSRLSYSAGIGSVEAIESAESDRNLALAFVAVGSLGHIAKPTLKIAKGSYSSVKKSFDGNMFDKRKSNKALSEIRNYTPRIKRSYSSIKSLKKEYSNYNLTTPRVNKRWIDNANSSDASVYLDIENAALKRLNDTLGDKELVTSLTNLHKDVLYARINKLIKNYDGIEFEVYSDFKSLRFAFTPKNIPDDIKEKLLKDLNHTYQNANQEYARMVKNLDGVGSENPSLWFEGGFASTADGAGQAAKRARAITRTAPNLVSYNDIKKSIEVDLNSIKSYSSTLRESPLYNANLVDEMPNGGRIVKLEVIETVRKSIGKAKPSEISHLISSNPTKLTSKEATESIDAQVVRSSLSKKFGVELTESESRGLVQYISQLDGLTPGLRQESRITASLDNADFGGFSGDVTGMGARNIQQVAKDLAKVKSIDSEEVLKMTRHGEQEVTQTFNKIKDNFTETVKTVLDKRSIKYSSKCSGDDCIVVPVSKLEKSDEVAIVNAFRKQDNPSQYRLSFIPPNIESSKRTLLATHGELMEKELRKQITGVAKDKISHAKLSKITMGTRMPASVNSGEVQMYLGLGKGIKLTSEEREFIETAYTKAVRNINGELASESDSGAKFLYNSGGVNFID